MRKSSPAGLVVPVLVLALGAWGCSDGGGGGTGTAGTGGGATGRGGTGGGAAGTGGGAAGTGGSAAGTGGSAAGTGGSAAGTGGATGGSTAGTGGATGGSAAGTGGATGGSTAGTGGATGGSTAGTGGGTGGGTAGTGGAPPVGTPAPNPPITGSATRPQLTAGTDYTILKYFEKAGLLPGSGLTTDNWDPTAGVGDVATFTPMFTVAATGGTHTTVQAALDATMGMPTTTRIYIRVNPGMYKETVCLKSGAPPITLYGTTTDASQTVIVNNGYAGKVYTSPPPTDPPWNPCASGTLPAANANYGTSGSATAAFYARDFQAKNLTFQNDYVEVGTSNIQAVALMTQNDKMIFENVRVLGNQDSLYVKTGNPDTVQRAYFKNCYVEGDTDFIFGRATFVLDNCEIKYLGARRGATSGGYVVSPSTDFRNAYGLLIINSMFTSDGVPNAGTVFLGRAWDESQASGGATYPLPGNQAGNTGGYPNGQVVIRDSVLGAHIAGAVPWTNASTTSRPYSSVPTTNTAGATIPANRLWEFTNTGAGAATP